MQVLKFSPPPYAGPEFRGEDLPLEAPQDLEKLTEKERPAALVVRSSNLPNLARFGSLVIDRGVKHPAKSLSQLLLKHQKIPLIDGRHRAAGQLKRSIRTLLRNASALGDRNLYIIGVGDEIFEELWQGTLDSDRTSRSSPDSRCFFGLCLSPAPGIGGAL